MDSNFCFIHRCEYPASSACFHCFEERAYAERVVADYCWPLDASALIDSYFDPQAGWVA